MALVVLAGEQVLSSVITAHDEDGSLGDFLPELAMLLAGTTALGLVRALEQSQRDLLVDLTTRYVEQRILAWPCDPNVRIPPADAGDHRPAPTSGGAALCLRLQCDPRAREDLVVNRGEGSAVAGVEARDFDSPDETRTPDKTQVDVVRIGGTTAARFAFEPGWRWSECVKPVAGTESCQARHVGVAHSGRIAVKHEDGTEIEIGPGEAYVIEPGHDAWVVGDEGFVGFEFEERSAKEYAKG